MLTQPEEKNIDQKIKEIVNERILKLLKIGLKHELTVENIKQYFKEVNKSKLYELRRYFSDSPISKIQEMIKFLYNTGVLVKGKDGWYSLK